MSRAVFWLATAVGLAAATPVALSLSGCFALAPDCNGDAARQTIGDLFRKELKLTPYVRFIDLAGSTTQLDAVFTVRSDDTSATCVAFVKFIAKRTAEGLQVDRRNKLAYGLLYEMESGRQIYYTVKRAEDGQMRVRIDRVGG